MNDGDLGRIRTLIDFLSPSFDNVLSSRPYTRMLPLVVDASLQAAINYERIVLPRVQHVVARYPWCVYTADAVELLRAVGVEEVLQWKGQAKQALFRDILQVLVDYDLASVAALADWITTDHARSTLLQINGLGSKTFDYIRLLCGQEAFPLDRHLARFLAIAGVDRQKLDHVRIQTLLTESCHQLGIDPRTTERRLWLLMRACS
jgi:hypothetical protein